jgi:threonine dehydrogenase-like Zn-dependent dehydrogenase
VAILAKACEIQQRRALIVGAGAVGLRSATLLAGYGCDVTISAVPPEYFEKRREYHPPAGITTARAAGIPVIEPRNRAQLLEALAGVSLVLCAGPSGIPILGLDDWAQNSAIEVVADYNAVEPLGIDGVAAADALVERHGKLVLGALGVGDTKMRVHKACVRRLFERNDAVLDVDGVYAVARSIV